MPDSPAPPVHEDEDSLAFASVPTERLRHDGWTPQRQHQFVQALAAMGVVARAAKAAGMSAASAYALRRRDGAADFASAWDVALTMARERVYAQAIERATVGIVTPRYYKGRQVGTHTRFDYRLALAVLRDPGEAAYRKRRP